MSQAKLLNLADSDHHTQMAQAMLKGGVVGAIWGHHLYFMACNAFDKSAVEKMNSIKNRPRDQIFASPGAVDEAEEFANLNKCPALKKTAKKMGLEPAQYLEYLFKKFPLAVELYAKKGIPSTVTFTTDKGRTIWIAAHMRDRNYQGLLSQVRDLRRKGNKIMFAGTSLNLKGENTLTVKDETKVLKHFRNKLSAISLHPYGKKLKRLNFTTSSSVVSFIHSKPRLLRLGNTSFRILKKYIPDLEVSSNLTRTRKSS